MTSYAELYHFTEPTHTEVPKHTEPVTRESEKPYYDEVRLLIPNDNGEQDTLHLRPYMDVDSHLGVLRNGSSEGFESVSSIDFAKGTLLKIGERTIVFSGMLMVASPEGTPKIIHIQPEE